MKRTNVEIKARYPNLDIARAVLKEHDARFVGEDHQVDTYFAVPNGRLKLRLGEIERALIFYDRPDSDTASRSDVTLFPLNGDGEALKAVLSAALGKRIVVDKRREIYFVGNVKFHLDRVEGLGTFVEIEAIANESLRTEDELRQQCEQFQQLLDIEESALVPVSYSDLMLEKQESSENEPSSR